LTPPRTSVESTVPAADTGTAVHQAGVLAGETAREALHALEAQVAAEEEGPTTTTLAGVVLLAASGDSPTEEEAVLLTAIAGLHFARFDNLEGLNL
jgi:hypothetical protein